MNKKEFFAAIKEHLKIIFYLFIPFILNRSAILKLRFNQEGVYYPVLQSILGIANDFFMTFFLWFPALICVKITAPKLNRLFYTIALTLCINFYIFSFVNTVYIYYFGTNIGLHELSYLKDGLVLGDSVLQELKESFSLKLGSAALLILTLVFCIIYIKKLNYYRESMRRVSNPAFYSSAIFLIVCFIGTRSFTLSKRKILNEPLETHVMPYLFWRLEAESNYTFQKPIQGFKNLANFYQKKEVKTYSRQKSPYKNVVFVLLEGFGMPMLEKKPALAPTLIEMSQRGIFLPNHYSNIYRTCGAQFSALCSKFDPPSFFVSRDFPASKSRCLPQIFKDLNFKTYWFSGAPAAFDYNGVWLKNNGIDQLESGDKLPQDIEKFSYGVHDIPVVRNLIEKSNEFKSPFFLYLTTNTNHHPYTVPESFHNAFPEIQNLSPVEQTYRYTDEAIRLMMANFAKKPWFNETLFVFWGDHLAWGTAPGNFDNPDFTDIRNRYRTFAFFYGHNLKGKISRETSHIDLAPTVLDLLGIPQEPGFLGDSIFQDSSFSAISSQENTRDSEIVLHNKKSMIIRNIVKNQCKSLNTNITFNHPLKICTSQEFAEFEHFKSTFYDTTQWETVNNSSKFK